MRRAAVFLMVTITLAATSATAVEQGDVAPAWSAVDFGGVTREFPELLDGKPAVVVFWATWCPYCQAFMPYLRGIQADYGSERIHVLGINVKEDGAEDPRAYVADLALPMIAVPDGDAIAEAYGVDFVPGLMVVDAAGTVVFRRAWTDLPAGDTIARFWDRQVRRSLDEVLE